MGSASCGGAYEDVESQLDKGDAAVEVDEEVLSSHEEYVWLEDGTLELFEDSHEKESFESQELDEAVVPSEFALLDQSESKELAEIFGVFPPSQLGVFPPDQLGVLPPSQLGDLLPSQLGVLPPEYPVEIFAGVSSCSIYSF